jgi:hypothetical protein
MVEEMRAFLGIDPGGSLPPVALWRKGIVASDLPATVCHVALTLALHMDLEGGSCFPSLELLVKETKRNRATVHRAINRLINRGYLHRGRRGGRQLGTGGTPNWYQATWPDPRGNPGPSHQEYGQTVAPGVRSDSTPEERPSHQRHPTVAKAKATVAKRASDRRTRSTRGFEGLEVNHEGAAPKVAAPPSLQSKRIQDHLSRQRVILAADDVRDDVTPRRLEAWLEFVIESPEREWPDDALAWVSKSAHRRVEERKRKEFEKSFEREERAEAKNLAEVDWMQATKEVRRKGLRLVESGGA